MNIESLHLLRQINGQVIIRDDQKLSELRTNTDDNTQELERLRNENERLRSELTIQKTDIVLLRGERDSLITTIARLDSELTQAEYQRFSQQQQLQQQQQQLKKK